MKMSTMVRLLMLFVLPCTLLGCGGGSNSGVKLTGAGASFPAPLYEAWFKEYSDSKKDAQVNYQSIGSGGGVEKFIENIVDFGASDAAMTDEEMKKVEKGVFLLPMTAGSIVLAYNLEGVENLKLSRDAYVGIFLGKVKKWNDPLIAKANPNINLPDKAIAVVSRSDGSGTTFVFTQHLSAISQEWKDGPGMGKSVSWPVGTSAKGNEGITAQLKQTDGSIGYIEFGFAQRNKGLRMAWLENKAKEFIEPTHESASKTLAAVTLPENMRAYITDPEGKESYPIVSYTWVLAYKTYDDKKKADALKKVLKWCLSEEAQNMSIKAGYIPLPNEVREKVIARIDEIKP